MIIDITKIFPDSLLRIFFEAILWSILFRSFSKHKTKSIISFSLMVICPWAIISLVTIINGYPNGFGGLIIYVAYFIIYLLCYEGKTLKKLLYFGISFALFFIITIGVDVGLEILFPNIWKGLEDSYINQYTVFDFLITYVTPIFLALPINGIIRYLFRKKSISDISKYSVGYLLMPLSQISLIFVLSSVLSEFANYGYTYNSDKDYKFLIPICAIFLISLLADWYIFSMVDKTERINKKNIELIAQNSKNKIEHAHIMQIQKDNQELRKMRHDIINQHLSVSTLLNNNAINDAIKMLNSIDENIYDIIPVSYCSNNLLNAIFQFEASKASNMKVTLKIDAMCPDKINIADNDLCSLLTNVIDNAIESATKTDNKNVKIICKKINNNFVIHIENPFLANNKKKTNFFTSQKPNITMHGIGMDIVKHIVKKYNGNIDYEFAKNKFILDIFIII